jgi:hypothetical protein
MDFASFPELNDLFTELELDLKSKCESQEQTSIPNSPVPSNDAMSTCLHHVSMELASIRNTVEDMTRSLNAAESHMHSLSSELKVYEAETKVTCMEKAMSLYLLKQEKEEEELE